MKWRVSLLAVLLLPVSALAKAPSISGSNSNITVVSGSSGPHIFGDTRGRLVVACDMRSDTCSNGHKIITTRSTPVPCETSPGVWEIIPAGQGCYSVRGLESWAANTSYLAHGASLDQANWDARSGTTVERVADWWRVSFPQSSSMLTNLNGSIGSAGQSWTAACIAKQGPSGRDSFRMRPFHSQLGVSQYCNGIPLGVEWGLISCTGNTGDASSAQPAVFLDPPISFIPGDLEVVGCWLPRSDSPGRPCWGGEAPVTCAGDRHTISTEGWPVEAGEISVTWELAEACPSGTSCFIFDGRLSGANTADPFHIWINGSGNVYIAIHNNSMFALIGQQPAPGVPTTVTARRRDGVLEIYRDGTLVTAKEAGPFMWNSEANLGRRYSDATFRPLNGFIRSLIVRSFE